MDRLIVDGYNALHAWPPLLPLMQAGRLADARERLIALLAEHAAATGVEVCVVFDSHAATGRPQKSLVDGVTVYYGTAAASADHVIERLAHEATRGGADRSVVVATSDRLEREIVFAMGVSVMSTLALYADVTEARNDSARDAANRAREAGFSHRLGDVMDPRVRDHLERLRKGEE